jgi:hypothetical protein
VCGPGGFSACNGPKPANNRPLVLGSVIGGAIWLYALIDSPKSVRRANAAPPRLSVVPTSRDVAISLAY